MRDKNNEKKDQIMMASVRTSKRLAFGGFLGTCLVLLCLLAVKDMHEKVVVMTSSNSGYQKMTDSQTDKIRSLTAELEGVRGSKVGELKAASGRERALEAKVSQLSRDLEASRKDGRSCHSHDDENIEAKARLESELVELKRQSGRQRKDSEQLSVQLRDQIAGMSMERDNCQHQYAALFKAHQEASDNMQNMAKDHERLQLELTDVTATKSSNQLQLPGSNRVAQQGQNLNLRSSSSQPIGLEQPNLIQRQPSSTLRGGSSRNSANGIGHAPVAAQPPLNNNNHQHPVDPVQPHQLRREDVMEAPKVMHHLNNFENLDAQVDPVQQDHPGILRAPIYRDNHNDVLDEDEQEDAVDGQLLGQQQHNYHNKVSRSDERSICILPNQRA